MEILKKVKSFLLYEIIKTPKVMPKSGFYREMDLAPKPKQTKEEL